MTLESSTDCLSVSKLTAAENISNTDTSAWISTSETGNVQSQLKVGEVQSNRDRHLAAHLYSSLTETFSAGICNSAAFQQASESAIPVKLASADDNRVNCYLTESETFHLETVTSVSTPVPAQSMPSSPGRNTVAAAKSSCVESFASPQVLVSAFNIPIQNCSTACKENVEPGSFRSDMTLFSKKLSRSSHIFHRRCSNSTSVNPIVFGLWADTPSIDMENGQSLQHFITNADNIGTLQSQGQKEIMQTDKQVLQGEGSSHRLVWTGDSSKEVGSDGGLGGDRYLYSTGSPSLQASGGRPNTGTPEVSECADGIQRNIYSKQENSSQFVDPRASQVPNLVFVDVIGEYFNSNLILIAIE